MSSPWGTIEHDTSKGVINAKMSIGKPYQIREGTLRTLAVLNRLLLCVRPGYSLHQAFELRLKSLDIGVARAKEGLCRTPKQNGVFFNRHSELVLSRIRDLKLFQVDRIVVRVVRYLKSESLDESCVRTRLVHCCGRLKPRHDHCDRVVVWRRRRHQLRQARVVLFAEESVIVQAAFIEECGNVLAAVVMIRRCPQPPLL